MMILPRTTYVADHLYNRLFRVSLAVEEDSIAEAVAGEQPGSVADAVAGELAARASDAVKKEHTATGQEEKAEASGTLNKVSTDTAGDAGTPSPLHVSGATLNNVSLDPVSSTLNNVSPDPAGRALNNVSPTGDAAAPETATPETVTATPDAAAFKRR